MKHRARRTPINRALTARTLASTLLVAVLLAGAVSTTNSLAATPALNFATQPTGMWADGTTHAGWQAKFNGGGSQGIQQDGTSRVFFQRTGVSRSASDSHAALTTSTTSSSGDITLSARTRTTVQLRTATAPNPWERSWVMWNFKDTQHTYYFICKTNGWELGKLDSAYAAGQRFLATGENVRCDIGNWHTYTVNQHSATIRVDVDGVPVVVYTDQERPYTQGSIGLYTEDASTQYSSVLISTDAATRVTTAPASPLTTAPAPATVIASPATSATSPITNPRTQMHGVTVDDVSNLSGITASLRALPVRPTTRIVFDEGVPANDYVTAASAIHASSAVMGELLDSASMKQYSAAQYSARASEYVTTLGASVDIWEVGNEINGEWLGSTPDTIAKISAAYNVVHSAGKQTAITLYFNPQCWEQPENEMLPWATSNIPAAMKTGLDYVFVSYYEADCNNYRPTDWNPTFDALRNVFPTAQLGFGEVGMPKPATSTDTAKAAEILDTYYGVRVNTPGFIGGYFWWYFAEDMVPQTKPLFATLSTAMKQ